MIVRLKSYCSFPLNARWRHRAISTFNNLYDPEDLSTSEFGGGRNEFGTPHGVGQTPEVNPKAGEHQKVDADGDAVPGVEPLPGTLLLLGGIQPIAAILDLVGISQVRLEPDPSGQAERAQADEDAKSEPLQGLTEVKPLGQLGGQGNTRAPGRRQERGGARAP